ncbi:MAG: sulfoxide reductase heme-binding subunit YedZ [Halieaceae bacterium]|nr:sulfoxide reductase heme-binding subunit YedZ [Halieaceae bacterium]
MGLKRRLGAGRWAIHVAGLLSFIWLAAAAIQNQLGPDPIKQLAVLTGDRGFQFLLFSLAISPLARMVSAPLLIQWRRPAGLWAFYFLCLHLLVFAQGYIGWSWALLAEELIERPYISVGALAWLMLVPLALTSTRLARRKLGRRWGVLHRLVFVVAALGCVHLLWQVRADWINAGLYTLVCVLIVGSRYRNASWLLKAN